MKIRDLYEQVNSGHIISDIELQREIVYDPDKQKLVIDSIAKGIPLPAFYFWQNEDGVLEVLDGKQRIEAIKNFYQNNIEYNGKLYMQTEHNLQEKIDNTEIKDIICSGDEQLKREIFRRINTLGVPLSEYEVLNGLFNGEYLRGVSSYCEQDKKAKKVLGSASRGNAKISLLRLLGKIRSFNGRDGLYDYIKLHQSDSFQQDMLDIKKYISFIADVFDSYGGQLPIYFNLALRYHKDITIWKAKKAEINTNVNRYLKSDYAKLTDKAKEIEDIINAIINNISVDPKRLFTHDDKEELIKTVLAVDNKHQCAICKQVFFDDELQVDHIIPWSRGGRTVLSNAQLLCEPCNIRKNKFMIDGT